MSGQVMLTANQPRSGTHHFHLERPSCPLHCGRHEVRFVSEADVYNISFEFANRSIQARSSGCFFEVRESSRVLATME